MALNYNVLKIELDTDPLSRGYANLTSQECADDMNTQYRSRNRTTMSGDEVYNSANTTELQALTDANFQSFLAFCGRDSLDPFGDINVQTVIKIFGGGSDTISVLQAARVESISRASELGLGRLTASHIESARSL